MSRIQNKIQSVVNSKKLQVREDLNPYLGSIRQKKLINTKFTIISNNCWGGHVYRYFNLPYASPTVGLYFFSDDYVKFVSNIKRYLYTPIVFIDAQDANHFKELKEQNQLNRVIGRLDDVEIIFLHYSSQEEAYEKWNRRLERVNMDHLVFKMSEQNYCKLEHLKIFDKLPYQRKVCFTTKDYHLGSQVVFERYKGMYEVENDTTLFRKYVDLYRLINGV